MFHFGKNKKPKGNKHGNDSIKLLRFEWSWIEEGWSSSIEKLKMIIIVKPESKSPIAFQTGPKS